MLYQILELLRDLSTLYPLTAMFILLDFLLLSTRMRRLKREKEKMEMEEQQERKMFEQRQARALGPAA